MKNILKKPYVVLIAIVALLGNYACSDDYFNPEPFSPNKDIQVSVYDYLKQQEGTFNLFVDIIDITNYKDSVNINNATVLAAHNEGVKEYLTLKNINSIEEADLVELKSLMGKYVFKKRLTTSELAASPEEERSIINYPLKFSARKDKWKGVEGLGPLVIYIQDLKDPSTEGDDALYKVATSDIVTNSGVVLAFGVDHIFGF